MNRIGRIIYISLLFCVCLITLPNNAHAQIQVSSSVSPRSGSVSDEFLFSVKIEGSQGATQPELEDQNDFEVSYVGPETSVQIINGAVSSQIKHNYRLLPKHEGTLQSPIARVQIDNQVFETPKITIPVTKGSQSLNAPNDSGVFAKQTISKESIYINEQVIDTFTIFSGFDVQELNPSDATFDGFWVSQVGEIEQGVERVGRERYRTFKIKRALYPLHTGVIKLPELGARLTVRKRKRGSALDLFNIDPFSADPFEFFGIKIEDISVSSNAENIPVKALPKAPSDLPTWNNGETIVGSLDLRAKYDGADIKYGESKTIEVTITSDGNLDPIRKVKLDLPSSIRSYEESPQEESRETINGLIKTKRFRISLVPENGGSIEIPALRLGYFNPRSNQYSIAETDPIRFNVIGGPQPHATLSKPQGKSLPRDEVTPTKLREPTFVEKLFERISFQTLYLAAFLSVIFALVIWASIRLQTTKRPYSRLKLEMKNANETGQYATIFRKLLTLRWQCDCGNLTYDQMRAEAKKRESDSKLYRILSIIDALESTSFGNQDQINSNLMIENLESICQNN